MAKEMQQATSIHNSLRSDMAHCRDVFIDIIWFMWCANVICFVILAVAMKIGYIHF